jgi:hypothetical protein
MEGGEAQPLPKADRRDGGSSMDKHPHTAVNRRI